jgi:3-oxoacyl-[acyl-carrier protein] reductase
MAQQAEAVQTQMQTDGSEILAGQVAVVTGASRGIGAAVARSLARVGARVAVNYQSSRAEAEVLVAELEGEGKAAIAVPGDVRDEQAMREMSGQVQSTLGPVDILVCSTTGAPGSRPGPLLEQDPQLVTGKAEAQLAAILVPCRAIVPAMVERGRGHVITVSSTWSLHPSKGFAAAGIAKAAADAAMRSLALELGPAGVRANVVAPGFVHTAASERLPEAVRERIIEETPLRRAAEPEDVADAVLALVSAGRHVTGAYLPVDGGGAVA